MTTENKAAFARRMADHMGREVNRATVGRWAEAGRIVMDGELVNVEASLSLLKGTQGGRADVSDRHAHEYADKTAAKAQAAAQTAAAYSQPQAADLSLEKARRIRAVAEARIKAAEAEMREMERDEMARKLIRIEDVNFVMDDFGATLRSLMETLADRLSPVVFPLQSLEDTHAALNEAAENVLHEMFDKLTRRAAEQWANK